MTLELILIIINFPDTKYQAAHRCYVAPLHLAARAVN